MPEITLFSPIGVGRVQARNRILMSPMSQNSANEVGEAGAWHMVHYGSRAVGGCGIILMEDTAVISEGRVSSGALCLYEACHAQALAPIVSFCRDAGAITGIQIAHAGRKAWRDQRLEDVGRKGAGDEAFDTTWGAPRALSTIEVAQIPQIFATSALQAKAAGFDFIEIHAAHGYLIHQFLSPLTNQRQDHYGGDLSARLRLLKEIILAVKTVWSGGLWCRLPASDGHAEGLSADDIITVAREITSLGVELIDVAASNVRPDCAVIGPAEMQAMSKRIKTEVGIPTATGGASDPQIAQSLIDDQTLDILAMARPLLADPYWALTQSTGDTRAALWPNQYKLALPKPQQEP